MREALAVLRAYLVAELLRSRGFVYGILSLSLWLILFLAPITFFRHPHLSPGMLSAGAFVSITVFLAYSVATWDWAWELRWLAYQGILEYVIASGSSVFVLYIGVIPVSLIWYGLALGASYALLTGLVAPPSLYVRDGIALAIALITLLTVLLGYAMLLGAVTITAGTSGPVIEFIGWILPIATGGITPLRYLPEVVQRIALVTPFSYPAELLRYSLGISMPILPVESAEVIALVYSTTFLVVALMLFKIQLKKLLREGIKTVAMY